MSATSHKITKFINKRKLPIIFIWITVAIIVAALFAPNFINETTNNFDPPNGSDADSASILLDTYFPNKSDELTHLVVFHNSETVVLGEDLAVLTTQISQEMTTKFKENFVNVAGYYIFADTDLDSIKTQFISKDGTASILAFNFIGEMDVQHDITHYLRDYIKELSITKFDVYVTGMSELAVDTNESIERDMARIDSIVIPLVFLALLILLRNWRYFPITMAPIVMTILLSFGFLERYIVLTGASVQSFVPSVIISIVLGVGVDYNLFLLTRFREERMKGKSVEKSTQVMMNYAGHTVFTSGLTLTISLAGLALFPVTVLSSVGIAITVAILILLAINLTFTPALLLLFGSWIQKSDTSKSSEKADDPKKSRKWYRIGKFATKYNFAVLAIILLLTLPLSFQLLNTTPNSETSFFAPRGSDSEKGFEVLQEYFGPGSIGAVQLIVVPQLVDVWNENVFTSIHSFIEETIEQTSVDAFSISSHTWLNGSKIEHQVAKASITQASPAYNLPQAALYRQYSSGYVSPMQDLAALIEIILPVDPSSPQASSILADMKGIARTVFSNFDFGFTGLTATSSSSIDATFDLFALMILIVIIGIYALVGVMFKAVFLPARLIATIGLTISFIYGAATVVFEYDTFLNDIFPMLDNISVTFWMVPVMSFSIILGLGIDYDIFTIERIKENIWNGMENNEGIARGIEKTGHIITGAGVIMMIAFGGMMFSSSYILVQFGFVLTFSVLLDTFVVRSLLVPAIMSFGENLNWWPNKPPVKDPKVGSIETNTVPLSIAD
jgi:RND superfamily putative drug exporter